MQILSDVTSILADLEAGKLDSAATLFPLVYDELRMLAKSRMANERANHTLQTTALVHEAYVRLVDTNRVQHWHSKAHFFAAAAESMRRILVEHARRKLGKQRGGDFRRHNIEEAEVPVEQNPELILQVDEALDHLSQLDARAADLVKLHCFAGYSIPEAARQLGIPTSTAYELWAYAKAVMGKMLAS